MALSLLAWLPLWAREKEPPRSEAYREGQRALDEQDWASASRVFGSIAGKPGDEVDAALYWKAYADAKRGAKKDALDGLRKLQTSFPQSAWADDAKALEMELRDGRSGANAAGIEDEEMKLLALDGLMQMDSDRAVPVLEKILSGTGSERLKKKALFVLSQSDSPRAREILMRVAKTGQPMSLRTEAVRTLGIAGGREDIEVLREIAKDTSAPYEVRAAVVEAYMISGRSEGLVAIATSDPDPKIRAKAIDALGANGELPALRQLWASEKDPALRNKLLQSFGVAGDTVTLAKIARETTDPNIRRKAIEGLGVTGDSGPLLRKLYGEYTDPEDKKKVVGALMVTGEDKILIELFRAEKDPAMKKVILQQLSVMDSPEVMRLLMDVLGEKP
ncbi:MAG TPA: HEAT repeat domain-containing protein [Candidatus Polarisedimenticolaceae bacterium]|nr:HEAT repeat domain-containing protein [Candidatus Polarisedimenticolaceae bacterium]